VEIIPAIDLRGGRCVRLVQGDFSREMVFSSDPGEVARANPEMEFRRLYTNIVNEEDEPLEMAESPAVQDLPNTRHVSSHILAFPAWPDMPLRDLRVNWPW